MSELIGYARQLNDNQGPSTYHAVLYDKESGTVTITPLDTSKRVNLFATEASAKGRADFVVTNTHVVFDSGIEIANSPSAINSEDRVFTCTNFGKIAADAILKGREGIYNYDYERPVGKRALGIPVIHSDTFDF